MEAIPLSTCMWCLEGQAPHQDWHPTRAELLKIGAEMSARARERDRWAVRQMDDEHLVGYGVRLRRMRATALADAWPDEIVQLVAEWTADAEREYRWRQRAARLGADAVKRSGRQWADRVDVVKELTDLGLLIAFEAYDARPIGTRGWISTCPFHADRHPSLDIDTAKGVWLCRVCNVGGDAIRYAELRYGLSFVDAVKHLEERLGITPPEREIHGVQIVRVDGRR